jgi:hypothetical protein
MCFFLNGEGGIVLIAVNQGEKSVGHSVTDKTRKEIATELCTIKPISPIEVHYIELCKAASRKDFANFSI